MSVQILNSGALSLLQDGGRVGFHQLGLTTGGAMDPEAFQLANRLCDNSPTATAIETTLGGLRLQFQTQTRFAVTGGEMPARLNGEPIERWRSYRAAADDILSLGYSQKGSRCYVAVNGGFEITPTFGSSATVVRENLGGLNGHPLQAGDVIPCATDLSRHCWLLPPANQPKYSHWAPLRVIPGYQNHTFDRDQQTLFFQSRYQLSDQCDRMGYRLKGPPVSSSVDGILSEGICLGAIQLPADGNPIVLMNDHQTIGGYPKIGSVLSLDLAKLAQLMPGDKVNFAAITVDSAHKALRMAQVHRQSLRLQAVTDEL